MEFIDLLKVGANKKEAAIAASKITTPTVDMDGVEIQSVIALFLYPLMALEGGSDVSFDPTFGGEEVMPLAYALPKEDFISTFGDILHAGTYNFYSSNVDLSVLFPESTDEETGESEITSVELNMSSRVVSYPLLGVMYLKGMGNIYIVVPDDFMLKYIILINLVINGILDSSVLEEGSLMPDIGIPIIDMPGQGVIFGLGLYSRLGNMGM